MLGVFNVVVALLIASELIPRYCFFTALKYYLIISQNIMDGFSPILNNSLKCFQIFLHCILEHLKKVETLI